MDQKSFLLFFSLFFSHLCFANNYVARIVKIDGKSEVLVPVNKISLKLAQSNSKKKVIRYNDKDFLLLPTRLGMKINSGNIIRTKKASRLKLVYRNGDQINIAQATTLEISWRKKSSKSSEVKESKFNLIYGKFRGIIEKGGPRSNSIVKTKHAVMGIRGTDFSIDQKGTSGMSKLNVLRGSVKVKQKVGKKLSPPILVKQGLSAEVLKVKSIKSLEVFKTTKDELRVLKKETQVIGSDLNKLSDAKLKKELQTLEEKAIKTTLNDIKDYQPELYKKIKTKVKKNKLTSVEEINELTVDELYTKAPKKKVKISIEKLNLDSDPYNQYYKKHSL